MVIAAPIDRVWSLLLDPKIQRLPVRLDTYAKAPAGYPNPFKDTKIGAGVNFNADLSEGRYELVNSLYDRLITFRLQELSAAWKAIHDAEKKLGASTSAQARRLLREAREREVAGRDLVPRRGDPDLRLVPVAVTHPDGAQHRPGRGALVAVGDVAADVLRVGHRRVPRRRCRARHIPPHRRARGEPGRPVRVASRSDQEVTGDRRRA
jgi:hypothetical protein